MKRWKILGTAGLVLAPAFVALASQAQVTQTTMTSYICRTAQSSEKPNAAMSDNSTSLVCRPFAVAVRVDDGSLKTIGHVSAKPVAAPDLSKALTPQQYNAAFANWYMQAFNIPPAQGG